MKRNEIQLSCSVIHRKAKMQKNRLEVTQCKPCVFDSINYYSNYILHAAPYKYPPNMPIDVDYRVMSTFLDFYITLLKFVNYKLYLNKSLVYPPTETQENA